MQTTEGLTPSNGSKRKAPATRERKAAAAARGDAMQLGEIRKALPELEALFQRAEDADTAYADSIKAIAAKGGVSEKALKKYMSARMKGKLAEAHAGAMQLALLFEEL